MDGWVGDSVRRLVCWLSGCLVVWFGGGWVDWLPDNVFGCLVGLGWVLIDGS